jgi:hypothetical protein
MFKSIGKMFRKDERQSSDQAVLIHLDGTGLEDSVYETCDLDTLEEQLIEAMGSSGEWDGHESGEGLTTVFLYGSDAEQIFVSIEPVLKRYPLCRNAKVIIRRGTPGAPQREM